jgi:hypothetical protein
VAQCSKKDVTKFVDDRGSDGLVRGGLWWHGDGRGSRARVLSHPDFQ